MNSEELKTNSSLPKGGGGFSLPPKRVVGALFVLLLLLLAPCSSYSKEKKEKKPKLEKISTLQKSARTALKNQSGQDGARNAMLAALARPDVTNKQKADIYYLAALLEESLNGVENRKAYLKQNYDTARFFNKLRDMHEQLRLCDSIDCLPDAKGKVRPRMQKKTQALRLKHRRNIFGGGKFYLAKQNYAAAYPFFDIYCTYKAQPDEGKAAANADTLLSQAELWATLSAFLSDNWAGTVKHTDAAIPHTDSLTAAVLQEYKIRAYAKMGNDSAWVDALKQGVRNYPQHDYYFVQLADWYHAQKRYDEERSLADDLIRRTGGEAIHYYAKSKSYLAEDEYELCILYSDSTIALKDDFSDAYYNKGISYLNMAVVVQETSCRDAGDPQYAEDRQRAQELFRQARPCMEMVRKLQPEKPDLWASPLYRIYLNLNLGEEFMEIDKLLHTKK